MMEVRFQCGSPMDVWTPNMLHRGKRYEIDSLVVDAAEQPSAKITYSEGVTALNPNEPDELTLTTRVARLQFSKKVSGTAILQLSEAE